MGIRGTLGIHVESFAMLSLHGVFSYVNQISVAISILPYRSPTIKLLYG